MKYVIKMFANGINGLFVPDSAVGFGFGFGPGGGPAVCICFGTIYVFYMTIIIMYIIIINIKVFYVHNKINEFFYDYYVLLMTRPKNKINKFLVWNAFTFTYLYIIYLSLNGFSFIFSAFCLLLYTCHFVILWCVDIIIFNSCRVKIT